MSATEQPPRAADVPGAVDLTNIPPAVLTAIYDEFGCLRRNSPTLAAIATALREAKEQGAADTARLDWLEAHRAGVWHRAETRKWESRVGRNFESLRAAIDAVRAFYGEAEGSDV